MFPTVTRHQSALGRWTMTGGTPPGLAGLVEQIWDFDGVTSHRYERAFPGGTTELIVHLDDRCREARGDGPFERCPALCLSGFQTGPTVIEFTGRPTIILGIRLTALGAYLVAGRPTDGLVDQTVDLAALTPDWSRLGDALAEARGGVGRVQAAARWVADRVTQAPAADPAIVWLARQIEHDPGAARIDRLRHQIGYSKNRLATAFRHQVGLNPKRYARLLRFRRALESLSAGGSPSRVAYATGYYDQAHFTTEFRSLAGLTPSQYLTSTRYEASVNLAE